MRFAPLPKTRKRRGDHLLTKWNDLIVIIQHHAECEAVAAGLGQAAHAGKVFATYGRRGLDLDADDPAAPVFKDNVDFVALFVSEMKELITLFAPAREFQQFAENEGFEYGAKCRSIRLYTVWRQVF